MKGNVWLAGYIVLSLVAVGAAGVYAFTEYSSYRDKIGTWNDRSATITRLQKEIPTPTEENEKQFEKELEAYEAKVATLFESLDQFQKPLNEQLTLTEFPNILKQKVDDFRKLAKESRVDISPLDKPEPFFMAMDRYREKLPKQEITPLLNYQLEAIERLLGHLVAAKMGRIESVSREDLPGEEDRTPDGSGPDSAAGPKNVVQKYPINLKFEGSHGAFRDFLNRLSNDEEYFFILRVLGVLNSAPEGPDFTGDLAIIGFLREDGSEVSEQEIKDKTDGKTGAELDAILDAEGWVAKRQDAVILFGEETIEVTAVIDLVRFLSPEEAEKSAEPEDEKNAAGSSSRRPGNS